MNVTIKLTECIINALATDAAQCADGWFDACCTDASNAESITDADKKILYYSAYRDGMKDLFEMIQGKDK